MKMDWNISMIMFLRFINSFQLFFQFYFPFLHLLFCFILIFNFLLSLFLSLFLVSSISLQFTFSHNFHFSCGIMVYLDILGCYFFNWAQRFLFFNFFFWSRSSFLLNFTLFWLFSFFIILWED